MNTKIKKIESILDNALGMEKEKKKGKFKLPLKAKLNKKKIKEGFVTVAWVGNNMSISFTKEQIIGNTISSSNDSNDITVHNVYPWGMLNYKGKPLIIQPKWSTEPFNPKDNFKDAEKNNTETFGQKYILARLISDTIKAKKKISGALIFGLLIGGAVLAYVMMGS